MTTIPAENPTFSVVIPVFNEEECLPELVGRLTRVMDSVSEAYELILVNDGSTDRSLEMLRGYTAIDSRVKIIDLSRNFGHQAALYAGLCRASGAAVILMDADLQDPPEIIPRMIDLWRAGHQVVYGVRRKRKEKWAKRFAYSVYYRLLQHLAYVEIPLDSGDFSLIDRTVVRLLKSLPERNKFLRGLRSWVGFAHASIEYERDSRFAGKPKYTFRKLSKLALDGVISYSFVPLRISFAFGLIVSGLSFLLATLYFFQHIFMDYYIPQGFTTLAILILFLGGVQLLSVGLLGEYIGRIYDEVKRRPEYVERELIGLDAHVPPEESHWVSDSTFDRPLHASHVQDRAGRTVAR